MEALLDRSLAGSPWSVLPDRSIQDEHPIDRALDAALQALDPSMCYHVLAFAVLAQAIKDADLGDELLAWHAETWLSSCGREMAGAIGLSLGRVRERYSATMLDWRRSTRITLAAQYGHPVALLMRVATREAGLSVGETASVLAVPRSTFYHWTRTNKPLAQATVERMTRVSALIRYGAERIERFPVWLRQGNPPPLSYLREPDEPGFVRLIRLSESGHDYAESAG